MQVYTIQFTMFGLLFMIGATAISSMIIVSIVHFILERLDSSRFPAYAFASAILCFASFFLVFLFKIDFLANVALLVGLAFGLLAIHFFDKYSDDQPNSK